MEYNLQELTEILKKNKLRVTQSRLAVSAILLKAKGTPLTPEEIFKSIKKAKNLKCDQVSVYRALGCFEELSLVTKSTFYGEASRYTLCEPAKSDKHEHYFKCDVCNLIEPFSGCLVGKKEKELQHKGYKNLRHHLEINGTCPTCAQS